MRRLILFLYPIHPSINVWSSQDNPIDVEELPVVDSFDYDEIVITGVEVLYNSFKLRDFCPGIKSVYGCMGKEIRVLIHTYCSSWSDIYKVHSYIDGIIYSPRKKPGCPSGAGIFRACCNCRMGRKIPPSRYRAMRQAGHPRLPERPPLS